MFGSTVINMMSFNDDLQFSCEKTSTHTRLFNRRSSLKHLNFELLTHQYHIYFHPNLCSSCIQKLWSNCRDHIQVEEHTGRTCSPPCQIIRSLRLGQVRLGQVRLGQVRLGQSRIVLMCFSLKIQCYNVHTIHSQLVIHFLFAVLFNQFPYLTQSQTYIKGAILL